MNKKRLLSIAFWMGILVISVLYTFWSDMSQQKQRENFKKDVISYLEYNGFYEEADIEDVVVLNLYEQIDMEDIEEYQAFVLFEDEAKKINIYSYKKDSKELIQININKQVIKPLEQLE
ncbi:hypothetical protein [Aquibacillus saliphilus]|uniref:hypothetical protein n=1 Tax=Aquibacillus saliphilus TaxID=1909422 RepID=UPI001CF0B937|nr:hypothetical protein [Aquibacillus saliphilus]